MTRVPITAAMMVARKTAPHSIPDWLSRVGLTAMMYAIAKKVVRPATTSRPAVVPFAFS